MEDMEEIIEELEWKIKNYLGWNFALVRKWEEKLIKLKLELYNGSK